MIPECVPTPKLASAAPAFGRGDFRNDQRLRDAAHRVTDDVHRDVDDDVRLGVGAFQDADRTVCADKRGVDGAANRAKATGRGRRIGGRRIAIADHDGAERGAAIKAADCTVRR